jgi:hypothetical protein
MKCSICKQEGHNKRSCDAASKTSTGTSASATSAEPQALSLASLQAEIAALQAELAACKGVAAAAQPLLTYASETPLGILQSLANTIYTTEHDTGGWKASPLESLDKLKSDCSGKAGELLIEQLCVRGSIPHTYNCNINSKDGTYDIIINQKKIEIKTAKLGKQRGFQHESLRNNGYDYLLFLDVCPTYYYITLLPRFDLSEPSPILRRKAHLRKGTTDVFKLDFNEKILGILAGEGYTLKVTTETPLAAVTSFLTNKIENNE